MKLELIATLLSAALLALLVSIGMMKAYQEGITSGNQLCARYALYLSNN